MRCARTFFAKIHFVQTACLALALGCSKEDPAARPTPQDAGSDTAPDAIPDAAPSDATDGAIAPDGATDASAPSRLRVLFVGNSYTYVNDLPAMVTAISRATPGRGPVIETGSVTVGGATMRNHWDTGTAAVEIRTRTWNAVILQGQSVEPVLNQTDFQTYAVRLGMLANDNMARPVYYATWARREGDPLYAQSWSGGSVSVFTDRLDMSYRQAAARVMGATVARVGVAWREALTRQPTVNLYAEDGSHPSPAGTWLAACVIYRSLTGLPVATEADGTAAGVPAANARSIREIANASAP